MKIHRTRASLSAILAGLALAALPTCARSADARQPMEIEADQVTIHEKKGVSTYEGNVVVTQGSLRIGADSLTVYMKEGALQRIVATGTPVTYRQQPANREQPVEADAQNMELLPDKETVILTGDAHLQQGSNRFSSGRIVYDLGRDKVNAGSKDAGERVKITIQPGPDGDQP